MGAPVRLAELLRDEGAASDQVEDYVSREEIIEINIFITGPRSEKMCE